MTVVPSARHAAIIRFSVPVTVTMSMTSRAPFSRFVTQANAARGTAHSRIMAGMAMPSS